MSYFITPGVGMSLANPSTAQTFETTVVNNNFILLENGILADRTRLVSLETRDGSVADLTALAAIAAPAQGWTRTVIEGSALFEYNGAWIQISTAFFGSPAGRDAAYAKAGGVYKTNNATVFIPGTGFLNGVSQTFQYNTISGTWRLATSGRVAISPNQVAGTGVTLAGNKVNFVNNSADMNLYAIFTDEFDLYDITIAWVSAGTSLVVKGIDDSSVIDTGNFYGTTTLLGNGAAASSSQSALVSAITLVSGAFINGNIRLRVSFARQLQAALFEFEGTAYLSTASGVAIKGGSRRNVSAKVGGLDFQFSAAASGYIVVEGVRG